MKEIKYLVERMEEEIEDADGYIEKALLMKDERKQLADTLCKISEQEMMHYQMLHEQAVSLIEQHKQKHGEVPPEMKAIWEWEHKQRIEEIGEVKAKISHYKGGM